MRAAIPWMVQLCEPFLTKNLLISETIDHADSARDCAYLAPCSMLGQATLFG